MSHYDNNLITGERHASAQFLSKRATQSYNIIVKYFVLDLVSVRIHGVYELADSESIKVCLKNSTIKFYRKSKLSFTYYIIVADHSGRAV
jgi:hypothetical protein